MKEDTNILYQFLQLFRDMPQTDFDIISPYIKIRQAAMGEVLLNEGRTAKELFFVTRGVLKIVSVNDKGNDVIQFFIKENKFCTILYSFNDEVISHESIVAATDAEVFVFSKQRLNELYKKLPYFKELIEGITRRALMDKIKTRNHLMGEEATTRYLKFISEQPDIVLRVPLGDVASYLGITQQSLSRIRRNITF